jgi:hypothetical protein
MFGYSAGIREDIYRRLVTEAPREQGSKQAKNRYIS